MPETSLGGEAPLSQISGVSRSAGSVPVLRHGVACISCQCCFTVKVWLRVDTAPSSRCTATLT